MRTPVTDIWSQEVGLRVNSVRFRFSRDRPDVERNALQDPGQRIGDGVDLSGFGVDVESGTHQNVAEVEGTGDRRE